MYLHVHIVLFFKNFFYIFTGSSSKIEPYFVCDSSFFSLTDKTVYWWSVHFFNKCDNFVNQKSMV